MHQNLSEYLYAHLDNLTYFSFLVLFCSFGMWWSNVADAIVAEVEIIFILLDVRNEMNSMFIEFTYFQYFFCSQPG